MSFFKIMFYLQLGLVIFWVMFLIDFGYFSAQRDPGFQAKEWYFPMLLSLAEGRILCSLMELLISSRPFMALCLALWLSPAIAFLLGVLHFVNDSAGCFELSVVAFVMAVLQLLYACWVIPRLLYASNVLSTSMAPCPETSNFLNRSVNLASLYAIYLIFGIGGAKAMAITSTAAKVGIIAAILASFGWTTAVIRSVPLTTLGRVMYAYFGPNFNVEPSFRNTMRRFQTGICAGSVLSPVLGLIHAPIRAVNLVDVAAGVIKHGNRWGFVYIELVDWDFMQCSRHVWERFTITGMEPLINYDITGSFYFLSAVAVGICCSFLAGAWTTNPQYMPELSIYTFFIGYFLSQIVTAWPQACVSAHYVAYANYPDSANIYAGIRERHQQLLNNQNQQNLGDNLEQ